MKRIFLLACGLLSLTASAAVSTNGGSASAPTAAQIVERNVAARGGLAAWHAVKALTIAGQLDAGGKHNSELPFVMQMKRPHMSRLEVRFGDQTAVQVYDGTRGWKWRPFLGRDEVEPYTPSEAKAAESWQELDGPLLDHVQKGTRVELLGSESVEDHKAYKLKLTFKSGEERQLWVDALSFLELKIDGEPRKLDGKLRKVAIYYRDYKAEDGLIVPHVLETVVDGTPSSHKMSIDRVSVNPALDDALFAKPQPLLAKAAEK